MCHILAPHLTKLFNIIFDSGIYPDEWTVTTITPIFKGKESKDTESNYRGISVAGALAKLYGVVISGRLTRHLIIIIIKGHSLRRACLQPATNTQNSKPRPPTTNAELGLKQAEGRKLVFYNTILHYNTSRNFTGHRPTKVVKESHFLFALSTSKRHLIG